MVMRPRQMRAAGQAGDNGGSVLERLLALIEQGGGCTSGEIARRLGVSPRLVEMMLLDLQAKGYVGRAQSCAGACGGCEAPGACAAAGAAPQMWTALPRER